MTKNEFLAALHEKLSCLPAGEAEERIAFYGEMIDDRMDEGLSEEEAVAEIGTAEEIAAQIIADMPSAEEIADMPPAVVIKEDPKPGRRMRAWEVVLLILGSPLWISLLAAALAVMISFIAVVWALVVSLWAVFAGLVGCAFGGIVGAAAFALQGYAATGAASAGAALFCAGMAILTFFVCKGASQGAFRLTKKIFRVVGRCFSGGKRA